MRDGGGGASRINPGVITPNKRESGVKRKPGSMPLSGGGAAQSPPLEALVLFEVEHEDGRRGWLGVGTVGRDRSAPGMGADQI